MNITRRTLAAVAAGITAADIGLIRTQHPTLSTCIRNNQWLRLATVLLALHLTHEWRYDPLRMVADQIRVSSQ